ncbi:MAG: hypothetical protein JW874_10695 [Spirochaetales bacterium]|nr:hypothetical protein [Spirochaetales bacterium]
MKKCAIFAFNGDSMCFVHVLLNTLDMKARGWDVRLIVEGSATKTLAELADEKKPHHELYEKAKAADLIDCVCKACSSNMGVLDKIKNQGLYLSDEMQGHPGMSRYIDEGFDIITM